jgi:hypothetical protein
LTAASHAARVDAEKVGLRPKRGFFAVSVAKTKALSARHATRHNIWYRVIRTPEWAQWAKRAWASVVQERRAGCLRLSTVRVPRAHLP